MKSFLLLLGLVIGVSAVLRAQEVKLYGYVQKVTPGISATVELDENGKRRKLNSRTMENYQMYLAGPAKRRIYLVEGWIKGERTGLKGTPVNTPVILAAPGETGSNTELVPQTAGTVLQLTGTTAVPGKFFKKARTLARTNEVVVVYKLNGQFRYATLKQFTAMETVHLQ